MANPARRQKEFYSLKEVAEILQVSDRVIWGFLNGKQKLIKTKCFPAVKVGGLWRIPVERFNEWKEGRI